MTAIRSPLTLKPLLLADAATCSAMGIVLTAGSGLIGQATRIPPALLFYAGAILFPIAAFMAVVALCRPIPRPAAWLVVAGNAGWVAGSVLLLLAGWIAPNGLGVAFVAAQALAVALLAALEHNALRRAASAPAGRKPARQSLTP